MENKQLSLEDKVKPYLILAKVFDKQNKGELRNLILVQMLKQVKFKDMNVYSMKIDSIPKEMFIDFEEDSESKTLPLSTLIKDLNVKSIEEIKKQLEKAEKELNNGKQ